MIDHPNIQGTNPELTATSAPAPPPAPASEPRVVEGKLILPAIPDEGPPATGVGSSGKVYRSQLPRLRRPVATPLPAKPVAKLRYFWGKDPAYKVLMIAIGVVVVAGIVSLSLVSLA